MCLHAFALKLAGAFLLAQSPGGSAQFLGNLKQLAGSLKDSSPGQIAGALSGKNTKDLAASAAAAKASRSAVEALKDATPAGAAAALQHGLRPGGTHAPTTTTTPVQAQAAADPRQGKVVEALQSVGDLLQKAEDAVNGTSSDGVGEVLNGKAAQKAADALGHAVPKSLPEVFDPKSLQRAKDGVQGAKEAVEGSPQAQALKHSGKELAAALKLPSPGKVRSSLESSHPKVAEAIKRAVPAATDTLKNSDPAKVRKALREAGPEVVAAAKRFKSQTAKSRLERANQAFREVADAVRRRSLPWQWSLLIVLLAACSIAGFWHIFRAVKRRGARSPSLLVEQEIGTWMPNASSL
mmetsp:Transcript_31459/g.100333  ORF Transcript_31459/g.100333 Transcript_31459/m.100333 type:complete len:352 (-) Transcript_31459:297-1352(-)